MKKIFGILLRIVISASIILFLLRRIELPLMLKIIRGLDLKLFIWANLLFLSLYVLGVYRWQMLIRAFNLKPPISRVITAYCGGLFFNTFLPSTIGGDVFRTMDLFAHTRQGSSIVATVFLDRLSGFIALMSIAIFSLLVGYRFINDETVILSVVILFLLFLAIFTLVFSRRLFKRILFLFSFVHLKAFSERIHRFQSAIISLRAKQAVLIKNLLISFLIQGGNIIVFYLFARSLHIDLELIYFFLLIPVIGAISTLPISIGGLGLRDSSSVFYFGRFGVAHEAALSLSLIIFALTIIVGIFGGVVYVITLHSRRL
ncbi:MAG: lysylphosphatidylglycerol synthase transmembrane domain-containing protein [Candidatus Omnitrophota bacterium]